MSIFRLNRSSYALILIMLGIFLAGLWYANLYYRQFNSAEDPRVIRAKELYMNYNNLAEQKKYHEILSLLDTIESIYCSYQDYKDSYETGVLYNNRAAVYLNIVLFEPVSENEKDSLTALSLKNLSHSIGIYKNWKNKFGHFTEIELYNYFKPVYHQNDTVFTPQFREDYIRKRVDEMTEAQKEVERRLSVSYTNYGIVQRQTGEVEEALKCYETALELWPNNLTAKNNINILYGRPLEERGLIDRLFPPEK